MSKEKRKNPVLKGIIVIGLLLIASTAGFFGYLNVMSKPYSAEDGQASKIVVSIPSGTGTGGIADILEENGLIRSAAVFKLESRLNGYDGKYKAGQYELDQTMSMLEIMEEIISGKSTASRFTIPEGYTIEKIIDKLNAQNFINEEQFRWEIENGQFNYDFLKDAPAGENRLEGYLYPETYDFSALSNEHEIIDRLLSQFDKVFTDEYKARAKELGLNLNEVVTIASIIEGEAVKADEMSTISSVIYNRLEVNMPLQVDCTVQYVLQEHTDRVLTSHTKIDSPYNTYVNKGMPPGPIGNPGVKAIEAALYPADTDYIYFVAKGDGYHAFSTGDNYDEFLKNKKKYITETFGE